MPTEKVDTTIAAGGQEAPLDSLAGIAAKGQALSIPHDPNKLWRYAGDFHAELVALKLGTDKDGTKALAISLLVVGSQAVDLNAMLGVLQGQRVRISVEAYGRQLNLWPLGGFPLET